MILVIAIEAERKIALCVYVVVGILCFILIPNISRALEFALFIGYNPMIKLGLDGVSRTWLRRVIKLTLFIVCAVIKLTISILMMGITFVFEPIQQAGTYIALPPASSLVLYLFCEYYLGRFQQIYFTKMRSRFLRKETIIGA